MNLPDITYLFMIPMLEKFAQATNSYGWAIVLLTLLVRMLVWPLVANQTRSMSRMTQLQPQLKAIQERYQKTDPALFQKKTMEFYSKNKINPMGGCLPLLIQLPILLALFSTFTGPPFGDKPIEVKVKVVSQAQASEAHKNEVSGGGVPYVSKGHKMAKVIVFPGDSTVVQGDSIEFGTRALQGELPEDFQTGWQIFGKAADMKGILNQEPFGEHFKATFPNTGEFVVKATVPGIAKHESFLFINSLGKVAKGAELLQPTNWDSLVLILLFGATMFISQKLSLPKQKPSGELDDAQLAQQQSMKIMPFAVTGMFFFIPLPTGVYLYMVISNVMQSLQTFMVMKQPAPAFVSVFDDELDDVQIDGPAAKTNKSNEQPKSKSNGLNKEADGIFRLETNGDGEHLKTDSNGDTISDKRKKKKK